MNRRYLFRTLAALGAMTTLAASAHAADAYPSKPIKILVPYAAGGVVDPQAHLLHQSMVIDVVEAALDVPFECPLIREPSFGFRFQLVRTKQ